MTDIDRWNEQTTAEAQELGRRARSYAKQLSEIRGRATAGNGSITVFVDPNGRLCNLQFTNAAYKWGDKIPALILAAAQAAEEDAAAQAHKIVRRFNGDTDLENVVSDVRELVEAMKPQQRQPTPEELDDAYFQRLREDPLGRRRPR